MCFFAATAIFIGFASNIAHAQETRPPIAEIIGGFRTGAPIPMTPENTLILGGIADHLLTQCSENLSLSASERLRLADLASTASVRVAISGQ